MTTDGKDILRVLSREQVARLQSLGATVTATSVTATEEQLWRGGIIGGLRSTLLRRGALTIGSGGGGPYTAKAVHLPMGVFLDCSGLTTPDSPLFSYAFWARLPALPTSIGWDLLNLDDVNATINVGVQPPSPNDWFYQANTTDFASVISGNDDGAPFGISAGTWFNALGSFDISHATPNKIALNYVNNVANTDTAFDKGPSGTFSFNGVTFSVPIAPTQSNVLFASDYAIFMVWPGVFIDWTVAGNRAKIIDPNTLKPVNPSVAVAAFGQPKIMFNGDHTTFPVNAGSGGTFSIRTGIDLGAAPNTAGPRAWTAVGAVAGSAVLSVLNGSAGNGGTDVTSAFEATVSVPGQIQQTSSDNYFGSQHIYVTLAQGAITDASSSPSD